jgi:hypothetical protein
MEYFTSRYNAISKLPYVPIDIAIGHDDRNRWICYVYRTSIGHNRYQFTLMDNYMETYNFEWFENEITSKSGNKMTVYYNQANRVPEAIVCFYKTEGLLPLPDFAIDVLQTVQTNITFEVIRRMVVAFHSKRKLGTGNLF